MISVTIYRDELVAKGACAKGLALFDRIATPSKKGRMRVRVVDWTPLHAVWLRVAQPGFARWLQDSGLIPPANLCWADLSGADLHGANLHGANLHGADLGGADLGGANLCGANLCGANLRGANLHGANLHGADLGGADLSWALCDGPAPPGWRASDGRLERA